MMATSRYTTACFNTWIHCEELLRNFALVPRSVPKRIINVVDECALICMSTFHALKIKSVNASRYAVLCIGICEECAELCDEMTGETFRQCAEVCRQCSEVMSQISPPFKWDT